MTKVAFFDRRLLATFYKYATAVSVFLSFVFPFVDIPKDCLPAPSYGLWYKAPRVRIVVASIEPRTLGWR